MHAILETALLVLRATRAADISHFVPLIGEFEVAKMLSSILNPYTENNARSFVVNAVGGWELGYWLGRPFWGKGYATEAAAAFLAFAFEDRGAARLLGKWFHDNQASGRVLQKLGFQPAGEELSNCLARAHKVPCHVTALDRTAYMTRKNDP